MVKPVMRVENGAGHPRMALPRLRSHRLESQGGTILLVDDNPDLRAIVRRFLESAGYSVTTASDAEEAIRIYEDCKSTILLLLTDVTMPKMSGLDLADRILQCDPGLPILLMSGGGLDAGRNSNFIAKPFKAGELIAIVHRLLANHMVKGVGSEDRADSAGFRSQR